ncbi:MAG: cell division protein FtsQ/DivIB [Candidatus Accumulibacter sp.]|nr:cell division protein FtsQ/DivIB [Accumulibacter sp.]
MTALANLFFAAAMTAMLAKTVLWGASQPCFMLREVVFQGELKEVQRTDLERALAGHIHKNFFAIDLKALCFAIEQVPWVRHAEIRRRWPFQLEVEIEEHTPVAFFGWERKRLINTYGEVFSAVAKKPPETSMPSLIGPEGFAQEMLEYYRQAEKLFLSIGRRPWTLVVSPRLALRMVLDDGMVVELGRQQARFPIQQRLERFVEYYSRSIAAFSGRRPDIVDMRYPNGFAFLFRGRPPQAGENKGKS